MTTMINEETPVAECIPTGNGFKRWLLGAKCGERSYYYIGSSACTSRGHKRHIAVVAYQAHVQGLVHLVQRRMTKNGVFRYEAVRTSKPLMRFVGELAQV